MGNITNNTTATIFIERPNTPIHTTQDIGNIRSILNKLSNAILYIKDMITRCWNALWKPTVTSNKPTLDDTAEVLLDKSDKALSDNDGITTSEASTREKTASVSSAGTVLLSNNSPCINIDIEQILSIHSNTTLSDTQKYEQCIDIISTEIHNASNIILTDTESFSKNTLEHTHSNTISNLQLGPMIFAAADLVPSASEWVQQHSLREKPLSDKDLKQLLHELNTPTSDELTYAPMLSQMVVVQMLSSRIHKTAEAIISHKDKHQALGIERTNIHQAIAEQIQNPAREMDNTNILTCLLHAAGSCQALFGRRMALCSIQIEQFNLEKYRQALSQHIDDIKDNPNTLMQEDATDVLIDQAAGISTAQRNVQIFSSYHPPNIENVLRNKVFAICKAACSQINAPEGSIDVLPEIISAVEIIITESQQNVSEFIIDINQEATFVHERLQLELKETLYDMQQEVKRVAQCSISESNDTQDLSSFLDDLEKQSSILMQQIGSLDDIQQAIKLSKIDVVQDDSISVGKWTDIHSRLVNIAYDDISEMIQSNSSDLSTLITTLQNAKTSTQEALTSLNTSKQALLTSMVSLFGASSLAQHWLERNVDIISAVTNGISKPLMNNLFQYMSSVTIPIYEQKYFLHMIQTQQVLDTISEIESNAELILKAETQLQEIETQEREARASLYGNIKQHSQQGLSVEMSIVSVLPTLISIEEQHKNIRDIKQQLVTHNTKAHLLTSCLDCMKDFKFHVKCCPSLDIHMLRHQFSAIEELCSKQTSLPSKPDTPSELNSMIVSFWEHRLTMQQDKINLRGMLPYNMQSLVSIAWKEMNPDTPLLSQTKTSIDTLSNNVHLHIDNAFNAVITPLRTLAISTMQNAGFHNQELNNFLHSPAGKAGWSIQDTKNALTAILHPHKKAGTATSTSPNKPKWR